MIHARRVAHRRIFGVLVVAIPALWAAGLLLRPELPPLSPADRRLLAEAGFRTDAPEGAPGTRVVAAGPAEFRVGVERGARGEPLLALQPTRAILEPDLLVYWTPPGSDAPGAGSVLLGSLAGSAARRLPLPERAAGGGSIVVYSLAHGEVVARLALADALAAGPE